MALFLIIVELEQAVEALPEVVLHELAQGHILGILNVFIVAVVFVLLAHLQDEGRDNYADD